MEENNNTGNNSTQYIRSNNMGNTVDNKQRTTKIEDALSPDYSNPPLGNNGEQHNSGTEEMRGGEGNDPSSGT